MGGKARLALIAFILAASAVPGSAVRAGDTIVGGDCWQAGTPLICRNVWVDNNFLRVRLIDQLSNAALTSKAEVARSNWTSAAGPQILSWNSQVNDTWIYLKRNDGLGVPNGVTFNCNGTLVPVCSDQARAMMIVWTEIYVPLGNKDNAKGDIGLCARDWACARPVSPWEWLHTSNECRTRGSSVREPADRAAGHGHRWSSSLWRKCPARDPMHL